MQKIITISASLPSGGPKMIRTFSDIASGVAAFLDIWEENHAWAVGSGYCDPDEEFNRQAAPTIEAARLAALAELSGDSTSPDTGAI